jgi:hypothetical protein
MSACLTTDCKNGVSAPARHLSHQVDIYNLTKVSTQERCSSVYFQELRVIKQRRSWSLLMRCLVTNMIALSQTRFVSIPDAKEFPGKGSLCNSFRKNFPPMSLNLCQCVQWEWERCSRNACFLVCLLPLLKWTNKRERNEIDPSSSLQVFGDFSKKRSFFYRSFTFIAMFRLV